MQYIGPTQPTESWKILTQPNPIQPAQPNPRFSPTRGQLWTACVAADTALAILLRVCNNNNNKPAFKHAQLTSQERHIGARGD